MKRRIPLLFFGAVTVMMITLALILPAAAEERDGYSYLVSDEEVRIYRGSRDLSGEVTVPAEIDGYPVTQIGSYAFSGCPNITGVHLPSSVVKIENGAFSGCTSLVSVTIPDSVTTMGEDVFKDCTSLKSFTLSRSLTEIPLGTFSGCSSLETIIIPDHIQSVGISAFSSCSSAKEIYIPKSVTEIAYGAFSNCSSVEKITIPFVGESLAENSYRFFATVFGGNNQYSVPQSLKEVVILSGDIPKGAFEQCAYIEKIYISDSVSNIHEQAFYRCPSIKEIVVDKNNSVYHSDGNCLIESKTKRLILGCQSSIIPGDGTVTTIGGYAFGQCSNLKKIVVPNSVQKIECHAFYGCSSLEEISIPFVGEKAGNTSNTHFGYIFGAGSVESHNPVFIPESLKKVTITGDCSIGLDAFSFCRHIVSLTVTSNVKQVREFAFLNCSALQSVRFEGTLETIGQSAFLNCTSLKEILLPDSIQKIGNGVFENCSGVKILCEKDSVAEQYAKKYKLAYELIGKPAEEETTPSRPSETEPVTLPETDSGSTAQPETEDVSETGSSFRSETEPQTKGKGSAAVIGVAAVIALIAIVALIFRKKKA